MADADSSLTDSSLAPSSSANTVSGFLTQTGPNAEAVLPSDRAVKSDRRASLGLIDATRMRLSLDLHSLLRTNSKSQRIRTVLSTQAENPEHEHLVYPRYAKVSSHIVDLEVRSMDNVAEERQGRSLGARIVNFLNRSRSRSRSRKRRSRSLDAYPVDPMPATVHTASLRVHARHSSFDQDRDATVAGPSRPTTRIPSRPLSNTTIATNVTAKPRPKKAPEPITVPVAGPAPVATAGLVAQVVPIEHTTSNSSRKGKRINIFGILLPSPRKASFSESSRGRSRPTTPSPAVANTSDQAWNGRDERPLAEKSGSQRSTKSTRKGLPVHSDEPVSGCLRSSESGRGSVLPDLVSSQPRRVPVHVLNSPRRGEIMEDDPDADLISLEGRCSPLCGFGTGTSSKGSYTSMDKGKEKERRRSSRDRSAERTRESRKEKEREREREKEKERITHPRRVGSPLPRARQSASAVAVAAVPMEKSSSGQSGNSRRSGSKEHRGGAPRSGAEAGVAARAKRIKHGSFDFERPVSAGSGAAPAGGGINIRAALRNMGIGETERHSLQRSRSERAGPRRPTDDSLEDGSAPSSSIPSKRGALDKGKKPAMDVHFAEPPSHRTLDRSTSTGHHSQPTSHSSHSHPRSRGHSSHQPTHSNSTSSHGHRRDPVPASPMSTASGEASGESSGHNRDGSWGRSAGKRVGRASHGPFRFEPAVPPIPGSPADTEHKPASRNVPRPTSPSPLSSSTAEPMSRSQHARLAGKGRSLDLGLGLTWAPSKVREEAVLRVGGPRTGISSTTSSAARARSRWRGADEEGRLTAGAASDVAQAFKEALGDAAYGIFKNYVHRFDANAIPLDGPYGLLVHVDRLLDNAPGVDQRRKRVLLERFLRVVQDSEGR
ncbi:hypothetical protein GSI_01009 [Ganoderma sinense ZZ0214-1]|uniref:Uncharacterized protein n=1 Tax=Ganoderma sinense ZZ0214-1 TaxID=1077348 RepID=A0A2G8SU60_9APHY|nr:hypothetical protein GSI_01009 [Ganoderma sinense ZZ0214-1]